MLNSQKKKEQKIAKNLKFQIPLFFEQLLWRPAPGVSMNLGEQIWYALSEAMLFETFIPIWPHVSEKEKYLANIQNFKFHNSLNNFGRDPPQEYG